jgi:hypothetical protein
VKEPPDLRELVEDWEDLPPAELERLRRADAALRSVRAPPAEVPARLTRSIAEVPVEQKPWTPRRLLPALALAASFAAGFLAFGLLSGGEDFDARYSVAMEPTKNARGAEALIRVGEREAGTGNWQLELEVSGLPKLAPGRYYYLWLAKDGEYAATCGSFSVGRGTTTVRMNVSYRLRDYDGWVITANPQGERSPPWLLTAEV